MYPAASAGKPCAIGQVIAAGPVFACTSMSSSLPTPLPSDIAEHLAAQQCTAQWRGFFGALADEFASALSPQDLQALMARVGARFAAQYPLPAAGTLEELGNAMSQVWAGMDWGWVHLSQEAGHVDIHHRLSPVFAAFGADHVQWSGGFLEGVYQAWFERAGAGQLTVAQVAAADAWGCVHLRLAR